MKHPDITGLALYSGGDLPLWKKLSVRMHVKKCEQCREELAGFSDAKETLKNGLADLPAGLDWTALEREMRANIHVGLAAGEAIRPKVTMAGPLDWRAAMAIGVLTVVIATGWFLNIPRDIPMPVASVEAGNARLEAVENGIELSNGVGRLTMLTPKTEVSYTVDTFGSVSGRAVDGDTGRVTISNVSLE